MNKNILTKVIPTALVVATAFTLMGCSVAKAETNNESHTDTKTEIYKESRTDTDANGNKTVYSSTIVKDKDGNITTSVESYTEAGEDMSDYIVAKTFAIDNETKDVYKAMYFTAEDSEAWGEEILRKDAPLKSEEKLTYFDCFEYKPSEDGSFWKIAAIKENGEEISLDHIDVTEAKDPENITIIINYDEASNEYTAKVV